MEDFGGEDEKKFDVEAQQEEETQPDPDEELMLDRGNGRVWLVKIPKHLMTRWAAIDKEDIHLATIRIYPNAVSPSGRSPRIFLFLPPDPNDPTPRAPDLPQFPSNAAYVPIGEGGVQVDRYELDMVNGSVENQLVVAERPKDTAAPSSAYDVICHECNLRPLFNESYRLQMRERSLPGISTGSFADMIKAKQKPVKGTFERMARMPRNQLLDMLFQLFQEQPRWSIKPLRERTQQPEAYLKEVLNEIATLHRSGEYNGLWELSEIFAREGVKAENLPGASSETSIADAMMDDYDEDDDEDDMEEVS
ncbi:transcription initiation factor IIF, beta subunit-domain-containing protein [Pisolithus thermaeus]|nr:transcription initiation factor IIF, beta subunit-domain-containing protein [Pisolithus thermaeus]